MSLHVRTAHELVASGPLLVGVPPDAAREVLASLEVLTLSAGDRVLVEAVAESAGQSSDIYVVVEGELVVTRSLPGGRTERLSTMGRGEIFGELARADEGARSATVTAFTPAVIARIPGPMLDRLLHEVPSVMRTIAAMIARRLRAADEARLVARLNEERLSLIGKAAAMLVHDLKNPIGVVTNAATMIEEGVGEPPRWAAASKRAAGFMLGMVTDLLHYARGARSYARSTVALRDIVDDVEVFGLTPLEAARTVTVARSVAAVATLQCDRQAIVRALLNIVKNAGDAMESGGTLGFVVRASERTVCFAITDTGRGIPAAILPTLFEPFSTHGKSGGTGLGLAMARAAIDAHGGTIDVATSEQGTTFTVELPLAERL